MQTHTILGSGGTIGNQISHTLHSSGIAVRQVSRDPKPVQSEDGLVSADLMDLDSVRKATEGSEVCYLVAGLPYQAKLWEKPADPTDANWCSSTMSTATVESTAG